MDLSITRSPSIAASPIKWRSLGEICSGHLALFGFMSLICFFNISSSCSNNLTQVNSISNSLFFLIGYHCIAPQFFRFGIVVSSRCTGHIGKPEKLKRGHLNSNPKNNCMSLSSQKCIRAITVMNCHAQKRRLRDCLELSPKKKPLIFSIPGGEFNLYLFTHTECTVGIDWCQRRICRGGV